MTYSLTDIQAILQIGENSAVEFKTGDVRPESMAKEIVAFANSQGGVILMGVNDAGRPLGLTPGKNYEEWIMNIVRNNVVPAIQVTFQPYRLDGKTIASITVPRGKDKPYQTLDAKYLVRVGSTNRTASQAELLRLFQAAGVFHFDATPVQATSIKDLNLFKIDNYFNRYGIEFSHEAEQDKIILLQNSDILTEQGEVTVGGMLIFGLTGGRHLPQSGIAFAHFSGNEIASDLVDKQTITGTLDYQIDTGLAIIKNNWLRPSIIVGAKRVDTNFIYADKVFRELLTNACVHRNYAIRGSQIRVFMFDDRLEFRSPGRLPNTITVEKLKVGVCYAVNPILVKFMENLRYIDRLGRGLPMVYREAVKQQRSVEFKEVGEEFWVVLAR